MGNVSNSKYLKMVKLDYNNCVSMHQLQWNTNQQYRQRRRRFLCSTEADNKENRIR
ncbi:putative ent-copalyl diphosphate synthase [Helianthus annuus]|nr:putative ent-copalyl diphosphate synthase [Helianthus annuus]KAJ0949699.1 putative ent-copalyl diphosphate synthase [Helianthus annuus]